MSLRNIMYKTEKEMRSRSERKRKEKLSEII